LAAFVKLDDIDIEFFVLSVAFVAELPTKMINVVKWQHFQGHALSLSLCRRLLVSDLHASLNAFHASWHGMPQPQQQSKNILGIE
jgi:hypothetical protein